LHEYPEDEAMTPQENNWKRLSALCLLGAFLPIRSTLAAGGIVADGTVGPRQALGGTSVTIPQSTGSTVGKNLFHSFSEFNVNRGQTVTFTENVPSTLDNVISRVTGNSSSDINGTLQSTPGGQANFYLINPHGVIFGKNAKVDVPGTFHVSTADELRFKDKSAFNATQPSASSLSAASPDAFGFLGTSSANNGLVEIRGAEIRTKEGQTFDVVAGNVRTAKAAKVFAAEGEIRFVAMAGRGSVSVQRDKFGNLPLPNQAPEQHNSGEISISEESELNVSVEKSGRIALWGGASSITDSKVQSDVNGSGDRASVRRNNLEIRARTLTIGNITPNRQDPTRVSSDVKDSPTPGSVSVKVTEDLNIVRGGQITGDSLVRGNGGELTVAVGGNLQIVGLANGTNPRVNETGIFTVSRNKSGTAGNAGTVAVTVGKHIDILKGGVIKSDSIGVGRSGDVRVTAGTGITIDAVFLDKNAFGEVCDTCYGPTNFTGISADVASAGAANAGSVTVDSKGPVLLRNAGWISSSNAGTGGSGSISITTGGPLALENIAAIRTNAKSGNGGAITIQSGNYVNLVNSYVRTTVVDGNGNGGDIRLQSNNLVMDTGLIEANANSGNGGRVALNIQALVPSGNTVNALDVDGGSFLQSGRSLKWTAGRFADNLIRAVSVNGVDGPIDLTATQLNLSGTLANLAGPQFDTGAISQDYCTLGTGSSLSRQGHGGLPTIGDDPSGLLHY
jgi:filamentous hemagglutinin family protein